ncbi:MAG TPA: TerC family protein [Longimicrobiaceae bacterium]|nr:TerC family protein [Longimicrobiaceae bacterium]
MNQIWMWIVFNVFVLGMLAMDLGVFNRRAHVISLREALRWTIVVIAAAALFAAGIFYARGSRAGLEFVTGYVIELALSVDNIFVFVLIFAFFKVPAVHQHRVLFWGVFGALIMRGLMIGAGAFLIQRFHWIIYIFGAFLVVTGIRMALHKGAQVEPEANPVLRLLRRVMPVANDYDGQKFFTRQELGGRVRRFATPLFVVLVLLETTDLVFAVDSIPAIFAVTTDPFLVYTSNIFAILGLRSMYFLLAGVIERFRYLSTGLAVILVFVGAKMLVTYFHIEIPILASLGVIAGVLLIAVLASLLATRREEGRAEGGDEVEG